MLAKSEMSKCFFSKIIIIIISVPCFGELTASLSSKGNARRHEIALFGSRVKIAPINSDEISASMQNILRCSADFDAVHSGVENSLPVDLLIVRIDAYLGRVVVVDLN